MRILRALALVLVLANLLLFAAARGWLGGSRGGEPERLAEQLDAQKIVVVQVGAGATEAASSGEGLAAAGERPPSVPGATAEPATPPSADACRRYDALPRDKASRIAALARDARLKVVQKSQEEPSSWWVHIPSQPNREEVDKRIAELRAAGVTEFFVVQEAGPNHFAVSLGLFKLERMGQEFRDKLRAKGVSQARVTPRDSSTAKVMLELRGAADQVDALVAQVAAAMPGSGARACAGAP